MKKLFLYVMVFIFVFLFMAKGWCAEAPIISPPVLSGTQKQMSNYFYKLGIGLSHNAEALSTLDLKSDEARKIIAAIYENNSFIANCALINADGIIVANEPSKFKDSEGKDISAQAHFIKVRTEKKPVLSNMFMAVEGFKAIAIHYPIISVSKGFCGSISMLVKQDALFNEMVSPLTAGLPLALVLLQTDGAILYSNSPEFAGDNFFENKESNKILNIEELSGKIKKNPAGEDVALLNADGAGAEAASKLKKKMYWLTIGLFDTKWHLVMFSAESSAGEVADDKTLASVEVKLRPAMKSFADNDSLKKAMKNKDYSSVIDILREFYRNNDYMYCIQWIDKNAIGRGGWPLERSLGDYDFTKGKTSRDTIFVDTLLRKKCAEFKLLLIEGGTAKFYLYPVMNGDELAGCVYAMLRLSK